MSNDLSFQLEALSYIVNTNEKNLQLHKYWYNFWISKETWIFWISKETF